MADSPTEDPFDGWVLDDDFVKGAFRTEYSAEERIERMGRLDADMRRMPDDGRKQKRGSRPDGGRIRRTLNRLPRWWWVIALLIVAVIAVEIYQRRDQPVDDATTSASADSFVFDGRVTERPTPPAGVSDVPLGVPPVLPVEGGTYAFVQTQPGTDQPVAYDPCRPVSVVVNELGAPAGSEGLIEQAVADVAAATGLRFEIEGTTTEVISSARPPVQKARYGDRWAPVLISWTDPTRVADLEGDTVGVGGSQVISMDAARSVFVNGVVALDAPQLTEILAGSDGAAVVRGVIAHELGHVAGLDHVDADGELMARTTNGSVTTFGPGDLTGLARLGSGTCFPDL